MERGRSLTRTNARDMERPKDVVETQHYEAILIPNIKNHQKGHISEKNLRQLMMSSVISSIRHCLQDLCLRRYAYVKFLGFLSLSICSKSVQISGVSTQA